MRKIALVLAGPLFFLLSSCNQTPFTHSGSLVSGQKQDNKTGGDSKPDQPNFQIVKTAVFDTNCIQCHSTKAGKVKGEVDFDTYQSTLEHIQEIRKTLQEDKMPLPLSKPRVAQGLKDLIYKWIDTGTPE